MTLNAWDSASPTACLSDSVKGCLMCFMLSTAINDPPVPERRTPLQDCHVASAAAFWGAPLGNMSMQIANLLPDFSLPLITPSACESASPTACFSAPVMGCLVTSARFMAINALPSLEESNPLQDCHVASVAAFSGAPLGNISMQIPNLLPDFSLPLITPNACVSASPTACFSAPVMGCLCPSGTALARPKKLSEATMSMDLAKPRP